MVRKSVAVVALVCAFGAFACSRDPQKLKRQYFESGERLFEKKNYAEAIIQYRNAVSQDGAYGEARLKLGAAYEASHDLRNALREYVRAADLMPTDINAQLGAARMLLSAGQYPEARARAVAALAGDPKNPTALVLMADALAGMKDLDGAISEMEEAIDQGPQSTLVYTNLGYLQYAKGNRAAAVSALNRAIEIDPKSAAAHESLANLHWASGELADAERELKIAMGINPKSMGVNRALAAFYVMGGRPNDAEPYLKTYAQLADAVGPKLLLADFYLSNRRLKEAVGVLEQLAKEEKGYAPATMRLAILDFQDKSRRPAAYKTLEDVLERVPRNELALQTKARFLINDRRYKEALTIANAIVEANPQSVSGHYIRGAALEATGAIDDSISAFLKVLELAPGTVPAQVELASLHLTRGDGKAAADFLAPVLKARRDWGYPHFLLGQALFLTGNLAGAELELLGVAKANPSSAEINVALGRVFAAKRDLTRARQYFAKALQAQPSSIAAFNGLVTADLIERKYDAARHLIDARLASSPDDRALLFLAGTTFMQIGDNDRAEATFKKLLGLEPGSLDAYLRLASIYMQQGRLDDAIHNYEVVAKGPSKSVSAMTMIGMILELQNKRDEARKHYERALAIDPRAPVAANNLASVYAETGQNLDQALQLAQTAKAALPNRAEVSDTLGWIYYQKGMASHAVTSLREASQQNPENPVIHYHLGLAYVKAGNIQEGRKSLQAALKLNPAFQGAENARTTLASIKG